MFSKPRLCVWFWRLVWVTFVWIHGCFTLELCVILGFISFCVHWNHWLLKVPSHQHNISFIGFISSHLYSNHLFLLDLCLKVDKLGESSIIPFIWLQFNYWNQSLKIVFSGFECLTAPSKTAKTAVLSERSALQCRQCRHSFPTIADILLSTLIIESPLF